MRIQSWCQHGTGSPTAGTARGWVLLLAVRTLPGSLQAEQHRLQMPGHPTGWERRVCDRGKGGSRAAPAGWGLGVLLELLDPHPEHAPLGRVGVQDRHQRPREQLWGLSPPAELMPSRAGWNPSPAPSLPLRAGAASAPSPSRPPPQPGTEPAREPPPPCQRCLLGLGPEWTLAPRGSAEGHPPPPSPAPGWCRGDAGRAVM